MDLEDKQNARQMDENRTTCHRLSYWGLYIQQWPKHHSGPGDLGISFFFSFLEKTKQPMERQIYLLAHFPNALKIQSWVRLKPGCWNVTQASCVGSRDSSTWAITTVSQGAH